MHRVPAILLATTAVAFAAPALAADPLDGLPTVDQLPEGVVQLSPLVPAMGEHWAKPDDMPLGPIYCVIKGKVVCVEYMIGQGDFEAGASFEGMKFPLRDGAKLPPIEHVDVTFLPKGHEGYEIPHYDFHTYFVPNQVLEQHGHP
jgi:hypothetical protein